jgi:hypothetical protein
MNLNEEQIDYIINLGQQLEYQRLERYAKAIKETKQVMAKYKGLKELKKMMDEGKYLVITPEGIAWSDSIIELTPLDEPKEEP